MSNDEVARATQAHELLTDEKRELDSKIDKLERFTRTPNFSSLDRIARALMRQQVDVMREYSGLLARRIELISRGIMP